MRHWQTWLTLLLLAVMICFVPFVHVDHALATRGQHAIISQRTTTIAPGQSVEDVLVIGNNVTVAGDVSEILVVVNGNIHLTSSSRSGIVVDLGGTIHSDPGARVDSIYHASLSTPFWNGILFGVLFALLAWAGMLAVSVCAVILAMLIAVALKEQVQAPLKILETSVGRTGFTGVLASLATIAVSALLAATIVGIPVTFMIVLLYVLGGIVGFACVSLWAGKFAFRNSMTERPRWLLTLTGASLMMAFSSLPFVGMILFLVFWFIGIGVVAIWGAGLVSNRRKRKNRLK